jgi:hypothetical protein
MPSTDSKSWRPPIPEFQKNRTPCVGTTGRHRSEQVDGIHRNQWSAWPGLCSWLGKARQAYLGEGRSDEWCAYLQGLISKHYRKYSLRPQLEALR